MAVLLWQRYQRGDKGALDLLLSYNREDVVNLEVLMDGAFAMEQERLLGSPRHGNHPCLASPR
jgi:uncharacterized protein YprB with RNaseH-like and TPR domain